MGPKTTLSKKQETTPIQGLHKQSREQYYIISQCINHCVPVFHSLPHHKLFYSKTHIVFNFKIKKTYLIHERDNELFSTVRAKTKAILNHFLCDGIKFQKYITSSATLMSEQQKKLRIYA